MARVRDKRLIRMYKMLWELGQIGWRLDTATDNIRSSLEMVRDSGASYEEILEIEKALAKDLRLGIQMQKQWKRVKFNQVWT